MVSNATSTQAGPVPFKDFEDDVHQATVAPVPERPPEDEDVLVSSLPSTVLPGVPFFKLRFYQGFWLHEGLIPGAIALQRRFEPHPDDVVVASIPKCGTTWLAALAFATMARRAYPPAGADHPLLRLNPHHVAPFMDLFFAQGREAVLDALPSPRLMFTHMPLAMLPRAVPPASGAGGGGCRVVYICREPKDMAVSLWHFRRVLCPELSFADTFESFCAGRSSGPFWDHILGYWRASAATPDNVLFLRYEELLRDPADNVRKLARFVGLPFSDAEEEAGVVHAIVELCNLDNMRSLEANKSGHLPYINFPNKSLFRKGVAGDWVNHMTPEMARRMDDIVAEKFRGTGLTFP